MILSVDQYIFVRFDFSPPIIFPWEPKISMKTVWLEQQGNIVYAYGSEDIGHAPDACFDFSYGALVASQEVKLPDAMKCRGLWFNGVIDLHTLLNMDVECHSEITHGMICGDDQMMVLNLCEADGRTTASCLASNGIVQILEEMQK